MLCGSYNKHPPTKAQPDKIDGASITEVSMLQARVAHYKQLADC